MFAPTATMSRASARIGADCSRGPVRPYGFSRAETPSPRRTAGARELTARSRAVAQRGSLQVQLDPAVAGLVLALGDARIVLAAEGAVQAVRIDPGLLQRAHHLGGAGGGEAPVVGVLVDRGLAADRGVVGVALDDD